jgi:cell division protein FtsI (penicillin-binding protein 3)
MGSEKYSRYIQDFGFGSLTGIELPGEFKGLVRPQNRWKPIDLAVTGFGQSIGVTSLQLTNAIAVIANRGEYGSPRIAGNILDSQGNSIRDFQTTETRTVISKRTADQVRAMMELVTKEGGTGVIAAPQGYVAAGKTGTAQVMDKNTKRYASNKYTSVFTGFVPAERPKLVITVVIHEPQGASYGGVVAGPVFREIASRVLPYMGVMPSEPDPVVRTADASSAHVKQMPGSSKAAVEKPGVKPAQKTAQKQAASIKNSGPVPRVVKKDRQAPQAAVSREPSRGKYSLKADERGARVY